MRKLEFKGLSLHYGRLKPIVLCIGFTSECLCCSVHLLTTLCSLQHAIQIFIDTDHLELQNIPFTVWQFAILFLVANGHVNSVAIKIYFAHTLLLITEFFPQGTTSITKNVAMFVCLDAPIQTPLETYKRQTSQQCCWCPQLGIEHRNLQSVISWSLILYMLNFNSQAFSVTQLL